MAKKGKQNGKRKSKQEGQSTGSNRKVFGPILAAVAAVAVLIAVVFALKGKSINPTSSGHHPARGPENARVTIQEYSDFQCPACKVAQEPLAQVLAKFPNDVRLEFYNFPLILNHPLALKAAEAAQCAHEQEKFWQMHDLLYSHQEVWPSSADALAVFGSYAAELGLDRARFDACLQMEEKRQIVLADLELGDARRIRSTPTFFINGTRVVGIPSAEEFIRVVEEELKKAGG